MVPVGPTGLAAGFAVIAISVLYAVAHARG